MDEEINEKKIIASEVIKFVPAKKMAVNNCYSLAINDYDDLFSWGSNRDGRLGHKEIQSTIKQPIKYDYFTNGYLRVNEIACGNDHIICVAIPKDDVIEKGGSVYSWGLGLYGRLGYKLSNNENALDISKAI